MLHINIICVGKIKETFFKDSINEYSKRLSKYCQLKIIEISDKSLPDKLNDSIKSQIIDSECSEIISHFNKNDYKICLDLLGKEYSSEEFAKKIENIQLTQSDITFVIGGSLGMNNTVKNMCNEKICFSKMTFPHQLIRIFLVEQLYRAFKINHNEKYHH